MSYSLLERLGNHLTQQGLLTGYKVKYYSWTDVDLKGKGKFIVLRMAGTSGIRDSIVQRPDVRVLVVSDPDKVIDGNNKADEIFQSFAGLEVPVGVLKLEPIGTVIGPMKIENGRSVFEINVRCYVQDH